MSFLVTRPAAECVFRKRNAVAFRASLNAAVVCGALTLLLTAVPARAQLFVHSLGDREFGQINLNTLTYNLIGRTSVEFFDIAFNPSGDLFGITGRPADRRLYQIDPTNAVTTLVGNHNVQNLNALAFRSDGVLFAAGAGTLYTMNPATGSVTSLGTMSGFNSAGDIAFDRNGNLYMTTTTNQLVSLNQLNGSATVVGDLGFDDVFGMAFDPDANIMYGISAASGGRRLFQINLTTGAGFAPLTYPSSINVGGGSFSREAVAIVVPEPTTLALLGVGCSMLGALVVRRRK